jgi:hypothetical protein
MDYKGFVRVKKSELVAQKVETKVETKAEVKAEPKKVNDKVKIVKPDRSQSQPVVQVREKEKEKEKDIPVEPLQNKYTKRVKVEKSEPVIQKEPVKFVEKIEAQPIAKETIHFSQKEIDIPKIETPVQQTQPVSPPVQVPQTQTQSQVPVKQPPVRKYFANDTYESYRNPYKKRILTKQQ